MNTTSFSIFISATIGSVSAELFAPDRMEAVLVLAHGAGAGMNHPFMISLSNELASEGIGTVRFNFPFTEQKKKKPDVPAVAHKTIESVISKTRELFAGTPLFAGGKSFGGRMTSQYLSKPDSINIKGIVFAGFPLHPPGKPSKDRAEHLKSIKIPMLFLQGTRDELAKWDLIEDVTSALPSATLVKIEGADHSFKVARQNSIPRLAIAVKDWMHDQMAST